VLTSPLIANNLSSLTFNYALPYSDTKISLLIEVLDASGNVVRSTVCENLSAEKGKVYTYDDDFDVEGTFMLRITNQGPSQYDGNKDRVAIWNITWTR
ncbi:MAG: hypothetical protein K2H98_09540, partial [Duncaniella sp.]|nr:hypothetical protein [Duncaniella sp.]